ncbi:hypothetical protein [Ferrimonas lipolytica]|uniref:Uncharacterized protein n=1 Tax=Ferrimonas lipolytica TaxID=2724191 RepID=A0A6H1UEA3_9GAMM|nr:hypothetical protein [Ferrimonas lipolytica]QIZ76122.1 hypothetical protein HER31_03975 [Ferrimonas lipolytica]
MLNTDQTLESLLKTRFEDAKSIAELRERLRDIEEEIHLVFAEQLSIFADKEKSEQDHHTY